MTATRALLARWHEYVRTRGQGQNLAELLAEDAVFHSPVVHRPQQGRAKVAAYLEAALDVLCTDDFRYVRELIDGGHAMLEFTTELDGLVINGVDIIRLNDDGLIDDFKVMIRPVKAVHKVWEKMAERLA